MYVTLPNPAPYLDDIQQPSLQPLRDFYKRKDCAPHRGHRPIGQGAPGENAQPSSLTSRLSTFLSDPGHGPGPQLYP